jgi:hypothetical protein
MSDYSALAQRVSLSIEGIRGCLMLSRDGMVLGAHPEGEAEALIRTAWVRFAGVGDPERSYVEFPDQIWAFVRRGGYAAFAVADVGVRPGVLVDLLEQALMGGEQDRVHERETMRLPDAPTAPSGKPRTILHKPERPSADEPEPAIVTSETPDPARENTAGSSSSEDEVPIEPEPPQAPGENPAESRQDKEDDSEVDRILLAKEFAGLLQVPKEDDEASR